MSLTFDTAGKLPVVIALTVLVSACGVRGNPVPPDGRDVLIETSDSKNKSDDDARFPAPEPVQEN
ncbi:MAG: hypothetical protein ACFB0Z_07100 [Candidatus Phaeomarinobacter sp.]